MSVHPSTTTKVGSDLRPLREVLDASAHLATSASLLVGDQRSIDLAPAVLTELRRQTTCTLAQATQARAPITCIGIGRVPSRPRLHPGSVSDWVVTPLEHDPLHREGRFPIPAQHRRHLRRLDRGGVHMDSLFVAHEIPKSLAPSMLPVQAANGPIEVSPEALPQLITHPGPARSTRRFAATAGEIAGAVGRMAGFAAGAVASAALILGEGVLDPVVFGVQWVPHTDDVAVVYELVRWEW